MCHSRLCAVRMEGHVCMCHSRLCAVRMEGHVYVSLKTAQCAWKDTSVCVTYEGNLIKSDMNFKPLNAVA
jgi:hypothetical protein